MSDQMAQSEELKVLKRIEALLEVIAKQQLRQVIAENLTTPQMRTLYDLTGTESVQSLVKKTGLSAGTISRTWQKWEEGGLLKKDGKRYRKAV
jgi:Fic family protein